MSIGTVRSIFGKELDGKAACLAARMTYDNATKSQVFSFDVVASGVPSTITVTVPATASIDTAVAAAGRDFAATLEA